jgi:hypothetical protein
VPGLLSPLAGFRAFAFFSHKVLRWCAPGLMAVALLTNAALLFHGPLYQAALLAQLGFYGLAFVGRMGWLRGALRRAGSVAYYFVSMNAAMAVGFWRFVRGSQRAAWDRTARTALQPTQIRV